MWSGLGGVATATRPVPRWLARRRGVMAVDLPPQPPARRRRRRSSAEPTSPRPATRTPRVGSTGSVPSSVPASLAALTLGLSERLWVVGDPRHRAAGDASSSPSGDRIRSSPSTSSAPVCSAGRTSSRSCCTARSPPCSSSSAWSCKARSATRRCEAGLATMPITLAMLLLSARAGALAERIGPRTPMTSVPCSSPAALLLMSRIDADSTYVTDVLPGIVVFGLGLALTVAPLTATALGAVSDEHAGVASGVNNAVARTGLAPGRRRSTAHRRLRPRSRRGRRRADHGVRNGAARQRRRRCWSSGGGVGDRRRAAPGAHRGGDVPPLRGFRTSCGGQARSRGAVTCGGPAVRVTVALHVGDRSPVAPARRRCVAAATLVACSGDDDDDGGDWSTAARVRYGRDDSSTATVGTGTAAPGVDAFCTAEVAAERGRRHRRRGGAARRTRHARRGGAVETSMRRWRASSPAPRPTSRWVRHTPS